MTSEQRKLAAILCANVEGYSRLMGRDELSTVQTITAYRKVFARMIAQYGGRVVNAPGDSVLAELGRVVAAVQCAVANQAQLHEANQGLPEPRCMAFRIGINLGDVIQQGSDIYGDGVNIAARVESLAPAGGIGITAPVFEQVKNKMGLSFESIGTHAVKNIAQPVTVYCVVSTVPGGALSDPHGCCTCRNRQWRHD
jgi:adenylate cyclase